MHENISKKGIKLSIWIVLAITTTMTLGPFFAGSSTNMAYAKTAPPPPITITSENIVDGEVRTPDIAAGAVTNQKIDDGAVTTSKVADNTVTTNKLADNSVTSAKIRDGTV